MLPFNGPTCLIKTEELRMSGIRHLNTSIFPYSTQRFQCYHMLLLLDYQSHTCYTKYCNNNNTRHNFKNQNRQVLERILSVNI